MIVSFHRGASRLRLLGPRAVGAVLCKDVLAGAFESKTRPNASQTWSSASCESAFEPAPTWLNPSQVWPQPPRQRRARSGPRASWRHRAETWPNALQIQPTPRDVWPSSPLSQEVLACVAGSRFPRRARAKVACGAPIEGSPAAPVFEPDLRPDMATYAAVLEATLDTPNGSSRCSDFVRNGGVCRIVSGRRQSRFGPRAHRYNEALPIMPCVL